jgi:hypothetical protein
MILLLSGVSAAGKSTLGAHLASEHGFLHFDMERPVTWPCPELHSVWTNSRTEFVARLRQLPQSVVLDWGFHPKFLSWALELQRCGVRLVWLEGDVEFSRQSFQKRNLRLGLPSDAGMADFDRQSTAITTAGLPGSPGFEIVEAFDDKGNLVVLDNPESLAGVILRE